jgi:hypothetical protein
MSHDEGCVLGVGTVNLHQHIDGALSKVTLRGPASIIWKERGAHQALETGVIIGGVCCSGADEKGALLGQRALVQGLKEGGPDHAELGPEGCCLFCREMGVVKGD